MKESCFCPLLTLAVLCLIFSLSSLKGYADQEVTLNYTAPGGYSSGPDYVYPYNFEIGSNSNQVPLLCLSFSNEIEPGDSWTASVGPVSNNLEAEAAWLLNDILQDEARGPSFSLNELIADQWAAWELFTPTAVTQDPEASASSLQLALAAAGIHNESARFFSGFEIYTPVAGATSNALGDYPQIFMGTGPGSDFAVTPEPSSWLLFASGLLILAGAIYCHRRAA